MEKVEVSDSTKKVLSLIDNYLAKLEKLKDYEREIIMRMLKHLSQPIITDCNTKRE